jgi:hypothetical protein
VATGTPPTQAAGGPSQSPAAAGAAQLQAAVTDINGALSRLKAAQQSGDFAAQGAALADLDKAVKRFNSAGGAPAAPGAPAPAAPAPAAPAPPGAPPAAPPANGG